MSHGLVIHAPTAEALQRALNNLKNFRADDSTTPLLLIANGPAVKHALELPEVEMSSLIRLCQNSLKTQGLEPGFYQTVASAVVEVHRLQQDGWSYWRA